VLGSCASATLFGSRSLDARLSSTGLVQLLRSVEVATFTTGQLRLFAGALGGSPTALGAIQPSTHVPTASRAIPKLLVVFSTGTPMLCDSCVRAVQVVRSVLVR